MATRNEVKQKMAIAARWRAYGTARRARSPWRKCADALAGTGLLSLDLFIRFVMLAVIIGALALAWLGTPSGRDFLAVQAGALLSDDSLIVTIGGVDHFSIGGIVVTDIQIADRRGVWLDLDRLRVAINHKTLFSRGVHIDSIEAGTLAWHRMPLSPPREPALLAMPDFDFTFDIPDISLGHLALDRLAAGADLYGRAENFRFDGTVLLRPRMPLQSHITLALQSLDHDDSYISLIFAPEGDDLDALRSSMAVSQGAGLLLGRLAGLPEGQGLYIGLDGAASPGRWDGDLSVQADGMAETVASLRLAYERDLEFTTDGRVTGAMLHGMALDYQAHLVWERAGRLVLRSFALESDDAQLTASLSYRPERRTIEGGIEGTMPGLSVRQGRCIDGCRLQDVSLSVDISGQTPYPALRADIAAGLVAVAGNEMRDLRLSLRADPVTRRTAVILIEDAYDITAQAGFNVHLRGFDALANGDGAVPEMDGSVALSYAADMLRVDVDMQGTGDLFLDGHIALPLQAVPFAVHENRAMTGAVRGRVDLGAVAQWLALDMHRVGGALALDASLGGTPARPDLSGMLSLQSGFYEHMLYGTALRDMTFDAAFSGQSLTLSSFRAQDRNGGRVSAEGRVDFYDITNPSYDVRLRSDRFQLVNMATLGVLASVDLRARGDARRGGVAGDVRINNVEYYISAPMSVGGDAFGEYVISERGARTGTQAARVQQTAGNAYPLDLDINIDAPNNIFVRGSGLESEWGAALALSGMAAEPLVHGRVFLVRGRYEVLDVAMALQRGEIRFTGPHPDNPDLDIDALIRGQTADAELRVRGSAQATEIELHSPDGLPPDELIARVLFGSSMVELTPAQAIRVAQFIAMLQGGGGGFDPVGTLRRAIGLDTLGFGMDEETGPTISAGKYVSDRVYIGVEQGSTPDSSSVRADIDITGNIRATTAFGADGESKAGINWKWDY